MMDHQRAIAAQSADRYLLGEMTVRERDEFEEHYFECPACAEDVRQGSELTAGLKKALEASAPEPAPSWGERLAALWRMPVWAPAAVAMASFLVYENAVTIPALRSASQPQSLATAVLRVVRAGADAIVRPGPRFFHLVAPVEATEGDAVRCEVFGPDSARLFSLDTPVTGGEISVLFPSSRFPDGRYMLVLTTANGRQELRRQAFRVQR